MPQTQMVRQSQFTAGEVDRIHWKRSDIDVYLTGAQSLRNCEIGTTGLIRKRKGTRYILDAGQYAETNSQLYEFVDKNDNFYLIISRDHQFNIFSIDQNTGALAFVQSVDSPYLFSDLFDLDYTLEDDVLVLVHPSYPPARIYVSSYSPLTFAYAPLNIYPLPAYDFGNINYNNFTVTLTGGATNITFTLSGFVVDPGFNNDWIGGQIIGAGPDVNQPIGYAIILTVTFTGVSTVFTARVQEPFELVDYSTSGNRYSIRQPVFTQALGYPKCTMFYQNRLWFGGTPALPSTVFGSRIGAPINFDVGTGRDIDAIVYKIGQSNSGDIVFLNGGKQLEIYTQNYEFAVPQEIDIGLTPSTLSIRLQSAYGSSNNLKPITYINDSYYISKTGNALINFHFNGIGQTYNSSNVSVASEHLIKGPINRALLRGSALSQDNFIYYLNPDSTVTAFQFASEYNLAALTPIVFESGEIVQGNVEVLDVTTINNEVYFLKRYNNDANDFGWVDNFGNEFVDNFGNEFQMDPEIFSIEKFVPDVKMDSVLTLDMQASGLVTGLDHLRGFLVYTIFDGQDYGHYTVEDDGTIVVNNPEELTGPIDVGLIYDVEIIPMFIYAGPNQADYLKYITRIYVDYFESLNFNVNGKLIPYQVYSEVQQGLPPSPKTGTAIINPVKGYGRDITFSITQHSQFDLNIISIGYLVAATII